MARSKELSILIPSRNEEFLHKTIEDILEHSEVDTEIIVGLDGWEYSTHIYDHPKITWIYEPISLGQRAMTNKLAKMATGKYVAKVDAHCSFAQGFDRQLLKDIDENTILTPMLMRLHAFDWKCKLCGLRARQDIKPTCHPDLDKEVVWQIEPKPFTSKYYFDSNLVFQYAPQEEHTTELVDTMALQGSFFMLSKEKYQELNICDESLGSWGFQGVETACKGWFNGMRVATTTNTYYGHMFRTSDIPYPRPQKDIDAVQEKMKTWFKDKDLKWLVEKFDYPCDWTKDKIKDLTSL